MKKVELGRTGRKVSQVSLGCMTMGTATDERTSARILDAYLDDGGDFLDTSVSTNLLRDGQNCKLALDLPVCPGSYVRHRVSSG